MIYLNNTDKFNNFSNENTYILTDFDKTLTYGKSQSSWAIISKSKYVPEEYITARNLLYDKYRPIETSSEISIDDKKVIMKKWWQEHINLLIEYKISEDVINDSVVDVGIMKFRDGAKELLKELHKRGVPVIIISAGIGNFIKSFLEKENCNYDNIHIVANMLKFENGIATGVCDNIIHTFNKNEVSLTSDIRKYIEKRYNIILMGDTLGDIQMASNHEDENVLKIGFLEEDDMPNKNNYMNSFDIVCTDNTSFNSLLYEFNILDKLAKKNKSL